MNIKIFLQYYNNKLTPPLQYAMMGFNLCHIVGFKFIKMGKMWVNFGLCYPQTLENTVFYLSNGFIVGKIFPIFYNPLCQAIC